MLANRDLCQCFIFPIGSRTMVDNGIFLLFDSFKYVYSRSVDISYIPNASVSNRIVIYFRKINWMTNCSLSLIEI